MTGAVERLESARAVDRLGALARGLSEAAERRDYAGVERALAAVEGAVAALPRDAEGAVALRRLRQSIEDAAGSLRTALRRPVRGR
jgi:hypothetical protein